jgi:hypothetical protein
MTSGGRNQLARQIGEHLVCAELARRGFYATPFAGNVPMFDIVAADDSGRIVRVQVKATRGEEWPSRATDWMHIEMQGTKQVFRELRQLADPDLIYVCVTIASHAIQERGGRDRFFILRARDLQKQCIENYSRFMDGKGWVRPRNPNSFDCRYRVGCIAQFENNWQLLSESAS